MPSKPALVLAGLIAAAAAALYLKKKLAGVTPTNVVAGAVGVLGEGAVGAVLGIGDVLGIPRTNETECQAALREGRTLDASFKCPAGTFIKSVFNSSTPVPTPTTVENPGRLGIGEIQYDALGNPM